MPTVVGMKSVLIDSSSAILLYKSGWLNATLSKFHLRTGPTASRELTIPGYPGAQYFQDLIAGGRLEILTPIFPALPKEDRALARMGAGERECILYYRSGAGAFILLDDGRGAAYCRAEGLPYVNALLMPRILAMADPGIDGQTVAAAMARIYQLGRYAPWVRDHARHCSDRTLSPFLP